MKRKLTCLLLAVLICLGASGHTFALEEDTTSLPEPLAAATDAEAEEAEAVAAVFFENAERGSYVSLRTALLALVPEGTLSWTGSAAVFTADGISITAAVGAKYIVANGRYLYIENGVRVVNGVTMVPASVLAQALGAVITEDEVEIEVAVPAQDDLTEPADADAPAQEPSDTDDAAEPAADDAQAEEEAPLTELVTVTGITLTATGSFIESGDTYYNSDSLYWLSRIINAESGNQSLAGKIAVGNVVLNRVNDARFPSTIYDVIFQKSQFSPASSGSIYNEPNAESVIAAKLALEGVNVFEENVCWFNSTRLSSSWAARNKTLIATIGGHNFYA